LGNAFSVTVTAFSGGMDAANQLEVDLQKDFARKSEQLEYISKGSYSCGNPTDPEVRSIEEGAVKRLTCKKRRNQIAARKECVH
jgi:hypothetical protein